ncbi:HAD superfamily hydrolase (TIGR01509 family) [Breoghania corrubedonensis]|uniref:HAD superfamily hydrolase (TIGR01509 family) n=1 Tax=Breoghania corrubedonensis TaxID=665038 RepID=A0A2T5V7V7_9HYPH|nr:HAD-IA family hydrolase [Breoghania corrubedonensis]PTW59826.1 HAD superfamily hydrolase (TIGR01509 family) [Breoghania corrubedonensis]
MLNAPLKPVDLVIFDCDGVLIDSEPVSARTLAETLKEAGLAMEPLDVQREFTGMTEKQMLADLTRRGITDSAAFVGRWREALYAGFKRELREIEGIGALVRGLDAHKCVASNSTIDRLDNSLGILDLWDAFAPHVFSAEMVANPKPAPDLAEHCLRTFDVAPERAVFIDDSTQGVRSAKAAGVFAIGFIGESEARVDQKATLIAAGADAVVTGVKELERLLAASMAVVG